MSKGTLRWAFSIVIGGVFLWLSLRHPHFQTLLDAEVTFRDGWLLGGRQQAYPIANIQDHTLTSREGWQLSLSHYLGYFGVLALIHFLRVIRWAPLLSHLTSVPFNRLNAISGVGFMAIFLFPLRLGELVRPYLLNREYPHTPVSAILGTVALERLADGLVVTLLLFLALQGLPNEGGLGDGPVSLGAWVSLALFSGGMLTLIALSIGGQGFVHWAVKLTAKANGSLASKVEGVLNGFIEGLKSIPNHRAMLSFFGLTIVYWCINGVGVWWVAEGFGISIPLSAGFAMMACVVVGMMIPNSPGNVGTFWYFLLLPLACYGEVFDTPQIAFMGIAIYLAQLIQQTVFGLWFLARKEFSVNEVKEATTAPKKQNA